MRVEWKLGRAASRKLSLLIFPALMDQIAALHFVSFPESLRGGRNDGTGERLPATFSLPQASFHL